jgi:hypothetical protein
MSSPQALAQTLTTRQIADHVFGQQINRFGIFRPFQPLLIDGQMFQGVAQTQEIGITLAHKHIHFAWFGPSPLHAIEDATVVPKSAVFFRGGSASDESCSITCVSGSEQEMAMPALRYRSREEVAELTIYSKKESAVDLGDRAALRNKVDKIVEIPGFGLTEAAKPATDG